MRRRTHNAQLAIDTAHAKRLSTAGSISGVALALRHIVEDRGHLGLTVEQAEGLIAAMANPVAFALNDSRETGWRRGSFEAKRSIASRLGLGTLAEEDR